MGMLKQKIKAYQAMHKEVETLDNNSLIALYEEVSSKISTLWDTDSREELVCKIRNELHKRGINE